MTSPTYPLSKILIGVLDAMVGQTSSYVKNSKSFAEFITMQVLTNEEILVSFDVISLFTCIPTGLAVQVACQTLEEDPSLPGRMDLSVDNIVGLLNLCLAATFLSFRGKIYRQVQGTAMGSPVSVVVKSFHSHLNSTEPCIQFTVEEESENRILPFLDVKLCQVSDGTTTTLVYRKTTHTSK